ncbi:MAG: leucine-rich repeat protein [Clostridia bacterium]|nr:leucine-rich repeat protein [Clostridia bacterium]
MTKDRMRKRTALALLALALLLVYAVTFADGNDTGQPMIRSNACGENLTWEYSNKTLTITGTGEMTDYTENAAPWSGWATLIKRIVLPDGMTYIGSYAFYGCSNVDEVTIPDAVEAIGSYAFSGCTDLKTVSFGQGLMQIGPYAFSGCTRLTAVNLPEACFFLWNGAFAGCTQLANVTLGYYTAAIMDDAFSGCKSLWQIEYHGTVTERGYIFIGSGNEKLTGAAWSYWTLTRIEWNKWPQTLYYLQGAEAPYVNDIVINAVYNGSIYVPLAVDNDMVTGFDGSQVGRQMLSVTYEGFSLDYYVRVVSPKCGENLEWRIENGTLIIEGSGDMDSFANESPWYGFRDLFTSVSLPDGLTSIGNYAFRSCTVGAIQFPDGLRQIGRCAFYEAIGSGDLILPEGLTTLEDWAFYGAAFRSVRIPTTLTTVGNNPFSNSRIEEVVFADGITEIHAGILGYCTSLTSVTIPQSVVSIGEAAFRSCGKLTALSLPSGITSIPKQLCDSCSALESISIPSGVTTIGAEAFARCRSITEIVLSDNITDVGAGAFYDCRSLTDVTLPSGLTAISDSLFGACRSLQSIELPATVTSIGYAAFQDCYALESINITGISTFGTAVFSGCQSLRSITLPDGMTEIPDLFFQCCPLTSISLPAGITRIGDFAFRGCYNLTAIELPPACMSVGTHAFENCYSLTNIRLDSVTSIGTRAFTGCTSLKTVAMKDVDSLRSGLFDGCSALDTVLCKSSASIADNCFYKCTALTSLRVPDGVTSIESTAFKSCAALAEITFPRSLTYCSLGDYMSYKVYYPTTAVYYHGTAEQSAHIHLWNRHDVLWHYLNDAALSIAKTPTQQTYVWNADPFSLDGCEILLTFDDGHTEVLYNDAVTVTGFDNTQLGLQTVTVSYYEAAPTTLTVRVIPGPIESIEVTALPTVSEYYQNASTFHAAGGKLTLHLENGESVEIDLEDDMVSGFDNSTLGECVLTAAFEGKTTTFRVAIVELPPNTLRFAADALPNGNTVEINGAPYPVYGDLVVLPEDVTGGTVIEYTYQITNPNDVHTHYPTSLKVWVIREQDGGRIAQRVSALDDVLQYAGSSIRITGQKGIRMITSVPIAQRNLLTGAGLAGFWLKEYGTIVQWDSVLSGAPLTLETPEVKRAYAYKKMDDGSISDPVFARTDSLIQYTNVLVGLTDEKCKPDLALRPYMILVDGAGVEYVIYGGTIHRSIGYIAYQNRAVFRAGTASYAFIWSILHAVYGDRYDAEYTP